MFHFWTRPKFPGGGGTDPSGVQWHFWNANLKLAKAKEVSESENQISKAWGREGAPVLETTEKVAFGFFLGKGIPQEIGFQPER